MTEQKLKYARDGFAFYSVCTPCIFSECELPENRDYWLNEDYRQWDELEALAENAGCTVEKTTYQRG